MSLIILIIFRFVLRLIMLLAEVHVPGVAFNIKGLIL